MTQPLNYSRQLLRFSHDGGVKQHSSAMRERWAQGLPRKAQPFASKLLAATKFVLPGGTKDLFLDEDYRGLDRELELRLPFPLIAIEFPVHPLKFIVLAEEHDEEIAIQWAFCNPANVEQRDYWFVSMRQFLPRHGALLEGRQYLLREDGKWDAERTKFGKSYADIVLSLLNILACSNVSVETVAPHKQPKESKGALPFDSYHVLSVRTGGSTGDESERIHRSPREHLRRGHIRRLPTGKRIWINAVVVNAGVGSGVVKDYAIR